MKADQFGNFAAGYVGYKAGWFFGVEGVLLGGILYDFSDAYFGNSGEFDWDQDSWWGIISGAYYARTGLMPEESDEFYNKD